MILVVDDDLSVLQQAEEILSQDRKIFLASDMNRAFELAQTLGFSVVLVDLNLRGIEGLRLIQRLHEKFPDLPIIAICGDVRGRLAESLKDGSWSWSASGRSASETNRQSNRDRALKQVPPSWRVIRMVRSAAVTSWIWTRERPVT